MRTAIVTGAEGSLGPRTRAALTRRSIVPVDAARRGDGHDDPHGGDAHGGGDSDQDGRRIAAVVDLGTSDHDRRAVARQSTTEVAVATLDLADGVGADHIVFVSSALVYGAHENNPLPLTEDAVLRPSIDFVYARQLASAEELVEQWRRERPGRTTAVLRPVLALSADGQSQLTGALVSGLGQQLAHLDPPAQFLHLDDLAEAVALAADLRLDGVFNVAPDGWVPGARVRALSGERPRIPLPERVNEVLVRWRWKVLRGPIPPGLLPYTRHPWVVANGRLRSAGWAPTVTNEQAYVEGTEAPWWSMVSPRRRQELALGGGALLIVAAAVATGAVLWRWRAARLTRPPRRPQRALRIRRSGRRPDRAG